MRDYLESLACAVKPARYLALLGYVSPDFENADWGILVTKDGACDYEITKDGPAIGRNRLIHCSASAEMAIPFLVELVKVALQSYGDRKLNKQAHHERMHLRMALKHLKCADSREGGDVK